MLRRAEQSAGRARRGVQQAGVRQREAAAGVSDRLRDAITEIRHLGGDELGALRSEVEKLSRRVDALERDLRSDAAGAKPRRKSATASRARPSKATARSGARATKRSSKSRSSSKPRKG